MFFILILNEIKERFKFLVVSQLFTKETRSSRSPIIVIHLRSRLTLTTLNAEDKSMLDIIATFPSSNALV